VVGTEEIQAALSSCVSEHGTISLGDLSRLALGRIHRGQTSHRDGQGQRMDCRVAGPIAGNQAFDELPQPIGFDGRLRPYQIRGSSWLRFLQQWGLGLVWRMTWTGQNDTDLGLIQLLWNGGECPVLLVCP